MFAKCSLLSELDVSNFDTSKVKNMNNMFDGCSCLKEIDISHFINAMNNCYMFSECSYELIRKVRSQNKNLNEVAFKTYGKIDPYLY
jgi:surface protein